MSGDEKLVLLLGGIVACFGLWRWYASVAGVTRIGTRGRERLAVTLAPVAALVVVHDSNAVIDVEPIVHALEAGAGVLQGLALPSDAPPAFLLDARRRQGAPAAPGRFDNRWVVFPQDFPSGTLLRSHGIHEAIVGTEADGRPEGDLLHVLRRWQDAGLRIRHHRLGTDVPTELHVPRPSHFRATWYRTLALFGLGRAAVGGFGTRIPVPSEGGRSGFYG